MERQNITHFEKRLLSVKVNKTSFFKPIDLKLFQEKEKKKSRSDVQQQPELAAMSRFRGQTLGPADVEVDCWGPILMPLASL